MFRSQSAKVSKENHCFPIEKSMFQNLTLHKIGQGQPRVKTLIKYDGLESQMLHTKFRGNRSNGSGKEDF